MLADMAGTKCETLEECGVAPFGLCRLTTAFSCPAFAKDAAATRYMSDIAQHPDSDHLQDDTKLMYPVHAAAAPISVRQSAKNHQCPGPTGAFASFGSHHSKFCSVSVARLSTPHVLCSNGTTPYYLPRVLEERCSRV